MKKLILIFTVLLPLISCSDSPVDLSAYRGVNYIVSTPFDPLTETDWVRTDVTGTYIDFAAVVPSTTTGLPSGTTDYSRLEIINLIPDGGFEGGVGAWAGAGTSVTDGANSIHNTAGNNSLNFTATSSVIFDINTLSGAADNTEYVIHFKFNKSTAGVVNFDYHDNATASYLSSFWTPSTSAAYTSTDFPTSDGEDNIIEIENFADNHYFSIGAYNVTTQQTGHIDDVKIVRNDLILNLGRTVPYTESGRPELYSGTYRFSIYVLKEDSAAINPTTPNRFPAETITLYINSKPTTIDVSSVTDSAWVQISAEEFVQIEENDSITLAVAPCSCTTPSRKTAGSILIAAPSLYYISD